MDKSYLVTGCDGVWPVSAGSAVMLIVYVDFKALDSVSCHNSLPKSLYKMKRPLLESLTM